MEPADTTLLAPPDDETSAAKSGRVYSEKVVSFHRLARTRGTPGSGIRPPEALLRMGMQSIVVLRADAAVLIDRRTGCPCHIVGRITPLVCSLNANTTELHNRR